MAHPCSLRFLAESVFSSNSVDGISASVSLFAKTHCSRSAASSARKRTTPNGNAVSGEARYRRDDSQRESGASGNGGENYFTASRLNKQLNENARKLAQLCLTRSALLRWRIATQ